MDTQTVHPAGGLRGTVEVPGDKSISHRALILGALSNRPCIVDHLLIAEDCLCTLEAFRAMGVSAERSGTTVRLEGRGLDGLKAPVQALWMGNSGTTTRLMMGVLTGQPFDVRLEGDASLSRRPMDRVIEPLSKMGAFFFSGPAPGSDPTSDKGSDPSFAHLPLRMRGTRSVRSLVWKSPVASAQVKSAVLLAGLYASGTTTVEEPATSRDHTERMLKACQVPVTVQGRRVSVSGTATVCASAFSVPGDLSSAAFLLAAGLLRAAESVAVDRVGVNPTRTGFIDVVRAMGGDLVLEEATEVSGEPVARLRARRSSLSGTVIGGDLIPRLIDEIPILTVLATQARGTTDIRDAAELRVKESDRITALREELSKMGARIAESPDGLRIEGPTPLKGAVVQSRGDHRLAMSLAVAALIAEGPTIIDDVACVNTSFPEFWNRLESLRRV